MNRKETEILLSDILSAPEAISPELYQYYNGLSKRRIILNSQIGEGIVEWVILPLLDMDNDGSGKPIEIILSTPGGSVFDGLCLCNVIDNLKTPTTIKVMGYAYSMGGLILAAGYDNPNVRKVCYPFSSALFHAGSTYFDGAANIVKDTFHFTEKMEEKIKNYVVSHSKITEEEYTKKERFEWYLCAEDMLRLGLVDEIL